MTSIPAREALQGMKRVDIQRLCKEYGVKANLKTEALIDLLLDESQPHPARNTHAQPPPRSTSVLGARPRGPSNESVIIRGADEGEENAVDVNQQPSLPVSVTPTIRKAKATQYKLGVGRPIIAGGSGARAVTKSLSVSRGSNRGKSTRNAKPTEETITEEPEPEPEPEPISMAAESSGQADPGSTVLMFKAHGTPQHTPTEGIAAFSSSQIIDAAVAVALAPIQKELEAQKGQLSQLTGKVSGIIESFETQIRGLTADIERLHSQASAHRAAPETRKVTPQRIPVPPSTPKRVRSPVGSFGDAYLENLESSTTSSDPSNLVDLLNNSNQETDDRNHTGALLPGFLTTLGKRPRDSNASATTAFLELRQEEDLFETEISNEVAQPAQKRAKVAASSIAEDESSGSSSAAQSTRYINPGPSQQPSARPAFSMFGGLGEQSDHVELPPPTKGAVDLPLLMNAPNTTVGEAQNPFRFTFIPTSTPAQPAFSTAIGTFPHPEPPTSPSPAHMMDLPDRRQSDRSGILGDYHSSYGTTGGSTLGPTSGRQEGSVNPLTSADGLQRQPSSNDVASCLGLTILRITATEEGTPLPPARRTMYGTELEDDTRFGDFGVEGVGSGGFWARGRQ